MSYFLFIDESGHDLGHAPYEVLAGMSIHDSKLWGLIEELHRIEEQHFDGRYTKGISELKGKKLLKKKVFAHAAQFAPIPQPERAQLARRCLVDGQNATRRQITALAQAKLSFVKETFTLAKQFDCRCFASIIDRDAPRPAGNILRKDYSYLFERFFYYLEDQGKNERGLIVFDELEKSQSHLLVDQMYQYFRETYKGQNRSKRIIPEPFFVHSDLTTGIQLADLAAYTINWGVRLPKMGRDCRPELEEFSQQVLDLRTLATRFMNWRQPRFKIWSFVLIDDLRPRTERLDTQKKGNAGTSPTKPPKTE